MKRTMYPILAMLLTLILLLCACSFPIEIVNETPPSPTETDAPTPTEPFIPEPDWSLVFPRQQNAGSRDYLPDGDVKMLRFEDMEYVHPDMEALFGAFDRATAALSDGSSAETVLELFYDAYDLYIGFYTMETLSNIRYYAEMSNEYYKEEYEFCSETRPDVEEKLERFLKSCAQSPMKGRLEELYFGEGELDRYLDYTVYTNPEYLELSKQEAAVMEDYHRALEDPQIEYEGTMQSYNDLMEKYGDDYARYLDLMEIYYNTYNPIIGGYYIQLLKIHRQMAQTLGYDSYADFCYDHEYGRDYTWEDGKNYVAGIRQYIVPLYEDINDSDLVYLSDYDDADENLVRATLDSLIGQFGGTLEEAYNYMLAYDLCDLTYSSDKMPTSFTTYIYDFESPYILINPSGTEDDIFTYAHEFGHFTDMYHSYQSDEDLETAETFSQGLEWLTLCYMDKEFSPYKVNSFRKQKLVDTASVFISQAAYADFEDRASALSDDELTVDALNDIFRQISKDYGFYYEFADFYYSMSWIDIPHFFEAPYYVISYCISADTALQIYQHELETPGAGLDLYNTLLDRTAGDGIQAVCEAACMENPFSEGRLKEIADFLYEQLDLR